MARNVSPSPIIANPIVEKSPNCAGVVGGSYFEVMGLRPLLGQLLDMRDDGPNAAGAAVLTYRF